MGLLYDSSVTLQEFQAKVEVVHWSNETDKMEYEWV